MTPRNHDEYEFIDTPLTVHPPGVKWVEYTMPLSADGPSRSWPILFPPEIPPGEYRQAIHRTLYSIDVEAVTISIKDDVVFVDAAPISNKPRNSNRESD